MARLALTMISALVAAVTAAPGLAQAAAGEQAPKKEAARGFWRGTGAWGGQANRRWRATRGSAQAFGAGYRLGLRRGRGLGLGPRDGQGRGPHFLDRDGNGVCDRFEARVPRRSPDGRKDGM